MGEKLSTSFSLKYIYIVLTNAHCAALWELHLHFLHSDDQAFLSGENERRTTSARIGFRILQMLWCLTFSSRPTK